jgi:hypothetical protein
MIFPNFPLGDVTLIHSFLKVYHTKNNSEKNPKEVEEKQVAMQLLSFVF